ncbi:alpha/beta fold hydrolase [Halomonas halocynthiae]|uniref:alpha/beta fold hydrolase n=1 Tax=Halomonas halocynthiae TaxID=176290 RepID=UPI00041B69F6|nr:alpha/beta hydrolase [Halomonas halocynthiae]
MSKKSEATACQFADGRLAALSWGDSQAPVWLALHGWLDNAASFSRLAPLLVQQLGIRVIAIDFSGHGQSRALPGEYDYALWDYCYDVLDVIDELALESVTLLAHSMGAGVACLLAAALPERVAELRLIDGLGALTTQADDAPDQLRRALLSQRRLRRGRPCYDTQQQAVNARVAGGATPVDADTITSVVQRNLQPTADGKLTLTSDSRLLRPSPVRLTPEQLDAMLAAIRCPTLLIEGEAGILGEQARAVSARAAVPALQRRVLPGGHHLHLELAHVSAVAAALGEKLAT